MNSDLDINTNDNNGIYTILLPLRSVSIGLILNYSLRIINFLNALIVVFDVVSSSSLVSIHFISAILTPFS